MFFVFFSKGKKDDKKPGQGLPAGNGMIFFSFKLKKCSIIHAEKTGNLH